MKTSICTICASVVLLVGCATPNRQNAVLVDEGTPGFSRAQYYRDVQQCLDYANQVGGAGEGAATGAIFGALVGAVLGNTISGHAGRDLAAYGAATGALGGAVQGTQNRRAVIIRCLQGRGYSVLN